MSHVRIAVILLGIAAAASAPLTAQELTAATGTMGQGTVDGVSYAWELEYRHSFARAFAWSVSWLNEGHAQTHHRDGVAGQLWHDVFSTGENFSLSFGAGAYNYSDTVLQADGSSANVHGWTPIYSLSASYYTNSPWFFRLTGNHVNRAAGLQSNTLVAGLGYRLGWKDPPEPLSRRIAPLRTTANEITAYFGKSIVNTSVSEDADARALEYRRGVGQHLDWTVTWLNEGDPRIIRRNGIATQLWLVDLYGERLTLGLGAGPYVYFDRKRPTRAGEENPSNLAALISPTVSYRFSNHWQARLTWSRVISNYDRDSDVILCGLGYRWGSP